MAVKPTGDNILVTQKEQEKKTEGGIILAAGASATTGIKPAYVLAVGPDVKAIQPNTEVYLKWSEAVALTHNGVEAALIKEESVLATIE